MLTDARQLLFSPQGRRLAFTSITLGVAIGCQRQPADAPAENRVRAGSALASASASLHDRGRAQQNAPPAASTSTTATGAPDLRVAMPDVLLSAGHASTCHVKVGDTFPNLTLASHDGAPVRLESQIGQRLTMVVFWSTGQPMSVEQIRRLPQEFASPYRDAGVRIVAVNVGHSAEGARNILADAAPDVVNLHDPLGKAFAEVATNILPRTYLLRPDRTIVWFDLEYSRSTARELHAAIRYELQQFERQATQSSDPLR